MTLAKQRLLLTSRATDLINGIHINYDLLLSELISAYVISFDDHKRVSRQKVFKVKFIKYLIQNNLQWNNVTFQMSARSANLELLGIIKDGCPDAFGVFYNALVLSDNVQAAKLLRSLIDDCDIEVIDGDELYKPTVWFVLQKDIC
jgi:hypothetical protein